MNLIFLFRKLSFDVRLNEKKEMRNLNSKTFYTYVKEIKRFGINWQLRVYVPFNDLDEIEIDLHVISLPKKQTQ